MKWMLWIVLSVVMLQTTAANAETWCEREQARLTALIAQNEAHEQGLQAHIDMLNGMLANPNLTRDQRLYLLGLLVQAHQDLQATLQYTMGLMRQLIAVLNICAISPNIDGGNPITPVPDPAFP